MVLALMFECDPRVETKEGQEKRVGVDAVVPLSKRMVYGRAALSSKESDMLTGKGMSITVPETTILVTGSIRSTQVPGGYFLRTGGCHHKEGCKTNPRRIIWMDMPSQEDNWGQGGSCPTRSTACYVDYTPRAH